MYYDCVWILSCSAKRKQDIRGYALAKSDNDIENVAGLIIGVLLRSVEQLGTFKRNSKLEFRITCYRCLLVTCTDIVAFYIFILLFRFVC